MAKNDLQQKRKAITALYRSRFVPFVSFASPLVVPADRLISSWHVDVFAGVLDKASRSPGGRSILNAPPGSFKSTAASILLPVFVLMRNPALKIVVSAGDRGSAAELHKRRVELVRAPRFRAINPGLRFDATPDRIKTSAGGQIIQEVVGYAVPVRDADIVIYDDPLTTFDAHSSEESNETYERFRVEAVEKLKSARTGKIIIVTSRMHLNDLTATLLRSNTEWSLLSIPAIAPETERWALSNGTVHTRRKGDVIDPRLADRAALLEIATLGGATNFMARYQQAPIASDYRFGSFLSEPFDRSLWTPERGLPHWFMGRVPELAHIQYELFGLGDPPPQAYTGQDVTDEEWEAATRLQQARLVADARN